MAYSDDRLEEIFERSRELNPDFLDNTASLAFEMHSDWLSVLAAENIKRINDADACDYVFHTASSTEFIFNACSKLSLPNEVKYSAVFIFDSFMVQLVTYFYQKVMRSKHSLRRKFRQWEHVEATLSRQIALRVLSAIQIASKMHSYHESLSIETVKLCLKKYGYCYPDDSIMKSELRMLSMIDWNPTYHCTPLVYVESLFKIINKFLNLINFQLFPETNKVVTLILCGLLEGSKWQCIIIDAGNYWKHILLLLDCVFICWDEVYRKMLANVMGPSSYAVSCGQLSRLQADWFLLACGIIVTSAFCIDGIAIADQFIEKLHQLCNIPMIDISDMCVAIIECTVD